MKYLGDFLPGDTVYCWWSTNGADGASITRATNGTVSVYKNSNTTQTTTGVTDTEDFDALTGVHVVAVATTDSFYVANEDYAIVLSGATVDGVTVNAVLGQFSICRRSNPSVLLRGTAQASSTTTLVLASATSLGDDRLNGNMASFISGTGAKQSTNITDYVNATDTATISAVATAASTDTVYEILPFGMVSATDANGRVDVGKWLGTACATPTVAGVPEVDITHVAGSTTNVSALATNVDAILTDTADMQPKLGTITNLGGGATIGANLADIEAQTDDIGVAGAGLTAAGLSAAGVRSAIGLASANLDTQLDALPTAAENATAVVGHADFVALDDKADAIKAKTDSLTYTVAGVVDANIQRINDVAITGDGSGTPFGV